jgi:hypothetical protein
LRLSIIDQANTEAEDNDLRTRLEAAMSILADEGFNEHDVDSVVILAALAGEDTNA